MLTPEKSKTAKTRDFDIGYGLWSKRKYSEAKDMFEKAMYTQEITLGKDHRDTLKSKYWLGRTLYDQKKYSEAKDMFKKAMYTQETTLGKDHRDTLKSKYWLGCTLYDQKKYSGAEELLRRVVYQQGKTFGKEHEDTLNSKYWLGRTLYNQKKYSEAEEVLRQVVCQQGRIIGEGHKGTLKSKYWLGYTLHEQKKYSDAEKLLRKVVEAEERALGAEHEDTLTCQYLLGLALYSQEKYREAEEMLKQAAGGRRRILGRGHEQTLETVRLLQECQLRPAKSHSDLAEKFGWQVGAEKFLWGKAPALVSKLTMKRSLGEGQLTRIEEVIAQGSNKSMARKQFFVHNFRGEKARAQIQRIKGEIASLRRLSHPHIVTILGCYQEEEGRLHLVISALMQPVGDNDLKTFVETEYTRTEHKERSKWIKKWFLCLASALAYMHSKGVHHDDIKPNNIIHRGHHVFFTDFGSSRRLEAGDETSTTSMAIASRLFAAPEASCSDDGEILRHGSKTDVFSLGLVFVELLVVLMGERIETWRNYVFSNYKSSSRQYHRVSSKFNGYFSDHIESSSGDSALWIYSQCFEDMLYKERNDRPSAKDVLTNMRKTKMFECRLRCDCARENMGMRLCT